MASSRTSVSKASAGIKIRRPSIPKKPSGVTFPGGRTSLAPPGDRASGLPDAGHTA
ncbi:hypothetical protein HMPREF0774_2112 [Staphylococcus aureus subsp. aureus TCH130]|nr:hypothetical protein HMPREF0774_2112 [Staphylococcus aureus subsp. aureus TCH130]